MTIILFCARVLAGISFGCAAWAHSPTALDAAIYKVRSRALIEPVVGFLVRDQIPLRRDHLAASVWPNDTLRIEFNSGFTIASVEPIFGAGITTPQSAQMTLIEDFAKRRPHGTVVVLDVSSSIVQNVAWANLSHFIQRLRFLPREPHVDLGQLSFLVEIPRATKFDHDTTGQDLADHGLDFERFGDTQFVTYRRRHLRNILVSGCYVPLQP